MSTKDKIILWSVVLLALSLRFWGINYGLPHRYWTEEYLVINYALRFSGGDFNPHNFAYPTLYLYFMFAIYGCYYVVAKLLGIYSNPHDFAVSFVRDPSAIYVLSRAMEALWGIVLVVIVYHIAKRWFGKRAALWSSLFTAVLPHLVRLAHMTKGDTAAACLALLALHFALEIAQSGYIRHYLLFGITLGLGCSIKYTVGPMGIVYPLAHALLLKARGKINWKLMFFSRKFLIGLLLIPVVFFLGSPYTLIDFHSFWQDLSHIRETWLLASRNLDWKYYFLALVPWIELGGGSQYGTPALGVFSLVSIIALWRWKAKNLFLWLVPIFTYTACIIQTPLAWGYVLPIFPIFLILSGAFIERATSGQNRNLARGVIFFAIVAAGLSLRRSLLLDHGFIMKDTRTIAKEWIDANIAKESRILMGSYPYSPPLLMSHEQLRRLYSKAVQLKHYKEQYLKLQIEAHPGPGFGYKINTIGIDPEMVGNITHHARDAQQVQDLIAYDQGMRPLKAGGIQYVIINSADEVLAQESGNPNLISFYQELYRNGKLLKQINPPTRWTMGPVITVLAIL